MLPPRLAAAFRIFVVMGWLGPLAVAQNPYSVDTRPPRGFMPTADQLTSPVDSIDPATGKLSMQIPLGSIPKTRGGFGFDLNLTYDSHLWDVNPQVGLGYGPPFPAYRVYSRLSFDPFGGGWNYNIANISLEQEPAEGICPDPSDPSYPNVAELYRLRIFLPDGSAHILVPKGFEQPFAVAEGFTAITQDGGTFFCGGTRTHSNSNGWTTFYSTDGSYLKVDIRSTGQDFGNHTWVLNYPDGRRIVNLGGDISPFENCSTDAANMCLFDANGNRIRVAKYLDSNGGRHISIYDDAGRTIQLDYGDGDTSRQDTITAPGPNGNPMTWLIDWEYFVIGDGQRNYVVTGDPPEQGQTELVAFPLYMVADVRLPTGTRYTFQYDGDSRNPSSGWGQLNYMRTSSGSVYTYVWQNSVCSSATGCNAADIANFDSVSSRTIAHDSTSDTWTYAMSGGSNTITSPDGGQTTYHFYTDYTQPWSVNLVFEIDSPNGEVTQRTWAQNLPYAFATTGAGSYWTHGNPFIQREGITPGTGTTRNTAVTDYNYDKNGNILQLTQYDWVSFSPGFSFMPGTLTPRRTESFQYYIAAPAASTNTSDFSQAYWQPNTNFYPLLYGDARRLNAVQVDSVSPDGNFNNSYSATYYTYDNYLTSGNATSEQQWKSSSPGRPSQGATVTTARTFNTYGNLTDIYEPASNGEPVRHTHIDYNDSPDLPSDVFYAYQAAEQRHWHYAWDSGAALVSTKTDYDNGLTTAYSYDNVGRQSVVDEAGVRQTTTQYDDQNLKVTVKRDLRTHTDGLMQLVTHYDQLGRVRLIRKSDGFALSATSETDGIKASVITQKRPMIITSKPANG